MKAMGEWRYNISILNLGINGVTCSTACHTALYPVSTEEERGWAQSWSGCSEEMKNILACLESKHPLACD
jgi:hypothetical protein